MALNKVVVIVQDGFEPFGLGAMCEVWAEELRPEDRTPVFDFHVVTPRPGRIKGSCGFDLVVDDGLEVAADADLICVSPKTDYLDLDPAVASTVRDGHERGAWIFAHCTGAFTLGEAGLLDGRKCTTHWRHAGRLSDLYPRALVDPHVLYVQDGRIITGAGSAAGLDAALHLMRVEFGAEVAAMTARRMVVPPHRDGGQAQYVTRPVPVCESETMSPLLDWMEENLGEEITVDQLAAKVSLSPRTFARRFKEATGTTPYTWLLSQRVHAAQGLLEHSDQSVEFIANQVGFAGAAALRHHFTRALGVSPQEYRRTFKAPA